MCNVMAKDSITLSLEELKSLERIAVQEAKLDILVSDFQENKRTSEIHVRDIHDNVARIYDLIRAFPQQIIKSKNDIENDLERLYLTKTESQLLEQHLANNIRSIKLWIVTSVGGFTSAGVFILWGFKLFG